MRAVISLASVALLAAGLAGCNGGGSSTPVPISGVTVNPTTAPSTSPSSAPSGTATASPKPGASATPGTTPTATPAPSATANSNQLTGTWVWGGNNTSNAPQSVQGNLPNVVLTAAASGYVEITADSTGTLVISNNTCPAAFSVSALNENVDLFVNRSVFSCNFVVTDQGSGKSVKVNYSNT